MFPRGESTSILQLSAVSVGQRLNIIHLLSRLLTETQDLYILSPSPRLSKLFKYRLGWKQEELWSLKKKKKRLAHRGKTWLRSPELHQTFSVCSSKIGNHRLAKAIAGVDACSLLRVKIFCFSQRYREKQKVTMCQRLKYV